MNTKLAGVLDAYTVKITELGPEDGGGYKATYVELGLSATGYGDTRAEAMAALEESALVLAESMAENGEDLPAPAAQTDWQEYGGRVTLRIPKALHAVLDRQAGDQDVSLNSLMASMLQSGATALAAGVPFGPMLRADPGAGRLLIEMRSHYDKLCAMSQGLTPMSTVAIRDLFGDPQGGVALEYSRIS